MKYRKLCPGMAPCCHIPGFFLDRDCHCTFRCCAQITQNTSHSLWQGLCRLIRFRKTHWVGHELLTDGNGPGNSVPIIGCVYLLVVMLHVAHMDVSRRTYECVMSHIWMCQVTHIDWHVTHLNEVFHTQQNILFWWGHTCHVNQFCHELQQVMPHI